MTRCVVEADFAPGVVVAERELAALDSTLRRHPRVDRIDRRLDSETKTVSFRFVVPAGTKAEAESAARDVLLTGLAEAGLPIPPDPFRYVDATTTRAVG